MNDTLHPHLTRQLDIIPLSSLGARINIIGAGAIGSFTALALAKMGFEDITVWDDDKIEVENMNCQFYRQGDIGKPKVQALKELVEEFTGVELYTYNERYTGDRPLQGIVITAVDSMEVRQMIWNAHAGRAPGCKLYVDPRMSSESALCYSMQPMKPKDIESYKKTLYSDANADHERCTAKATMYTACMLSGFVAKVVKDFVCGDAYPRTTHWDIKANGFQAWSAEP